MNTFKTFMLLTLLTVLFVFIGGQIGGQSGALIALGIAFVMNFFSYWFSSSIVLKMYSAKEVNEKEAPGLYRIVKNLATEASLPMPKVYVIQSGTPNAFATGRNPEHGVVAVTSQLLNMLNEDEIEGVLAHELSHIAHRDILIGTIAATVAGAIMMLANLAKFAAIFGGGRDREDGGGSVIGLLAAIIVAPLAATIVQMAVSRTREYQADKGAALLTKKPMALASALQKITYGVENTNMNASPSTAHMFIINPLAGKRFVNLFSTHPSTEDRIDKLSEIEKGLRGGMSTGISTGMSGKKSGNPMFR